jgi:hypothetical protein
MASGGPGADMSRQLSIAVVGADFLNKRGPTRRFEIALCNPGEPVHLVPEPRNKVDPLAIAVMSARGIQIGYVRAEQAQYIGTCMKRGGVAAVFQRVDPWGCTLRLSLDGSAPILPVEGDPHANDWPPPMSDDPDWWPDHLWPD